MSRRQSTGEFRPSGRAVPVTNTRPRRRFTLRDPITYAYVVAALVGTALGENVLASLLTFLHGG